MFRKGNFMPGNEEKTPAKQYLEATTAFYESYFYCLLSFMALCLASFQFLFSPCMLQTNSPLRYTFL